MEDLKRLLLKDIRPDENQPRKFYDETAMQELTDSIREKDVLQPILVRPNGKGYIIVAGERRYRAAVSVQALFKDRNTIPAVIRTLTDEEALEIQIIENLQRKDVHPMEEAVAFKSLLEKGRDIKEIATRVGKSDFYVRQRIKLNSLNKNWQKAYYHQQITSAIALHLATFDDKIQTNMWNDQGRESGEIDLNSWFFNRYSCDLTEAAFALDDATIDKKMGACTTCQFNSATLSLFPDGRMVCSKLSCFKHKTGVSFDRQLQAAKEDPEVILIVNQYSSEQNQLIKSLEKEGHQILNGYSHTPFDVIEKPKEPTWEIFKEDYDDDEDATEEQLKKLFEEERSDYEIELNGYNEKVSGGKYKKAFDVAGQNKGEFIYIKMGKTRTSKKSAAAVKEKESEGELTIEDITGEIDRIKEKEQRSEQIDEEKIWDALKTHFSPANNAKLLQEEFSPLERTAIASSIHKALGYQSTEEFEKTFGFKSKAAGAVNEKTFRQMLRFFMLAELPPKTLYRGFDEEAKLCLKIAEAYFPSVLKEIQDAQKAIADKRKDKIATRLSELNKKKRELTKPVAKKAQVKKPAAKKAAKKK